MFERNFGVMLSEVGDSAETCTKWVRWNGVSVNMEQVEPRPSISWDTALKVALSTEFILYYILVRAL
jgi:hypothetical protein